MSVRKSAAGPAWSRPVDGLPRLRQGAVLALVVGAAFLAGALAGPFLVQRPVSAAPKGAGEPRPTAAAPAPAPGASPDIRIYPEGTTASRPSVAAAPKKPSVAASDTARPTPRRRHRVRHRTRDEGSAADRPAAAPSDNDIEVIYKADRSADAGRDPGRRRAHRRHRRDPDAPPPDWDIQPPDRGWDGDRP